MPSKLAFKKRFKCGRDLYYPANNSAEVACKLARQKTLTHEQVSLLKALGHEISVETVIETVVRVENVEKAEDFKD